MEEVQLLVERVRQGPFRGAPLSQMVPRADALHASGQGFRVRAAQICAFPIALAITPDQMREALFEERKDWFEKIALGPAWAYGAACAILLLSVELIGYTQAAVPFVYFQF